MTEATIIKGGAMIATGSMMTELIIFNDPMYKYLAIVGALVSASGVLHELYNNENKKSLGAAFTEVIKGIWLGFLAIPLWFLLLSGLGDKILGKLFEIQIEQKIEKSVWLMISFVMSWYTVPISNWIVKFVTFKAKEKVQ